ncbi:MAG: hypothetical protein Q4C12_03545 [Clostridia bacterium]|nr:hypothetical protein [Clostridia bacterium]
MENSIGNKGACMLLITVMTTRFFLSGLKDISPLGVIICAGCALTAVYVFLALEGRFEKTKAVIGLIVLLFAAREMAETLFDAILKAAPINSLAVVLFVGATVAFCAYGSFRALGNITLVSTWFVLLLVLITALFSVPNTHSEYFGEPSVLVKAPAFWEVLGVFVILRKKGDRKRVALFSLLWAFVIVLVLSVLYFLCVSPDFRAYFDLPLYELSKMISFRAFFHRAEAGMIFVWIFSALIYISWCAVLFMALFNRLFALRRTKPISFCVTFLLVLTVAIPPTTPQKICEPEERLVTLVMAVTPAPNSMVTVELLAVGDEENFTLSASGTGVRNALQKISSNTAYVVDLSHLRAALFSKMSRADMLAALSEISLTNQISPNIAICVTEKSTSECFLELADKGAMGREKYLDILFEDAATLYDMVFGAHDKGAYEL